MPSSQFRSLPQVTGMRRPVKGSRKNVDVLTGSFQTPLGVLGAPVLRAEVALLLPFVVDLAGERLARMLT